MTRRDKVFEVMVGLVKYPRRDTGSWITTVQVCRVGIGGSEGMRRLRELREDVLNGLHPGYTNIEKRRKKGSAQWEYRLVPTPKGELFP